MKFTLSRLKVGDTVKAEIVESLSSKEFIINFNGDLIRVKNQGSRRLVPGALVELRVVTVSPFSFHLIERSGSANIDISI